MSGSYDRPPRGRDPRMPGLPPEPFDDVLTGGRAAPRQEPPRDPRQDPPRDSRHDQTRDPRTEPPLAHPGRHAPSPSHSHAPRPAAGAPPAAPAPSPAYADAARARSETADADAYAADPRGGDPRSSDLGTVEARGSEPRDLYAPARDKKSRRENANTPIVPAGSVTGRSLTLVISIMCFLACLTAGAVYMINQSAKAWLKDIASEVTIQVEPRDGADTEKTVREVTAFVTRQSGIANAKPLPIEASTALLEPWLGASDALKSLPVPRLIALEIDRNTPPLLDDLKAALAKQWKGVSLDDHRQWQRQIRTVTRSFALGGLAILALVAAATTAIIISATKSSMASNREIVEVLHFVGATDRFIAREFEKHFLRLGIRAGIVGAGSAMAVFLAMPLAMDLLGGGTVTAAEINRLIGAGGLDAAGYVLLGIVVVVVAALCMVTSRLSVFSILNSKD